MAATAYPKWKSEVLKGTPNTAIEGVTLTAMLVDSADYTYNAAHEFVTSVPAGARVASVNLTNVVLNTTGNNVFVDCDDFTFSSVSGDSAENVIIYINTGVEATSRLWLFIDNALGLPYIPSGTNVPVTVNASGLWYY